MAIETGWNLRASVIKTLSRINGISITFPVLVPGRAENLSRSGLQYAVRNMPEGNLLRFEELNDTNLLTSRAITRTQVFFNPLDGKGYGKVIVYTITDSQAMADPTKAFPGELSQSFGAQIRDQNPIGISFKVVTDSEILQVSPIPSFDLKEVGPDTLEAGIRELRQVLDQSGAASLPSQSGMYAMDEAPRLISQITSQILGIDTNQFKHRLKTKTRRTPRTAIILKRKRNASKPSDKDVEEIYAALKTLNETIWKAYHPA